MSYMNNKKRNIQRRKLVNKINIQLSIKQFLYSKSYGKNKQKTLSCNRMNK